jgi:hypothetical protein
MVLDGRCAANKFHNSPLRYGPSIRWRKSYPGPRALGPWHTYPHTCTQTYIKNTYWAVQPEAVGTRCARRDPTCNCERYRLGMHVTGHGQHGRANYCSSASFRDHVDLFRTCSASVLCMHRVPCGQHVIPENAPTQHSTNHVLCKVF